MRITSRIHQSQSIIFAFGERHRKSPSDLIHPILPKDVRPIDKHIVHRRRSRYLHGIPKLVHRPDIPIIQQNHPLIFVVVRTGGPIDDNSTKNTLPRLKSVMRMIPGRPVLRGSPAVRHGLPWCNGALCKGNCAIHGVRVELADSVKVEAGTIVDGGGEFVSQVDDHSVAPVDDDGWTWDCSVDGERPPLAAIGCELGLCEVEPELSQSALVGDCGCVVGVDVVIAPFLSIIRGGSGTGCVGVYFHGVVRW